MWIKEIRLKNYRAFREEASIKDIRPNHHLLIYGENGSGKSSLYRGVRTLLRSSSGDFADSFEANAFLPSDTEGYLTLNLDDGTELHFGTDDEKNNTDGNTDLISAAKIGGFLDYKRLLPVYQSGSVNEEENNVFDLIVRNAIGNQYVIDPRTASDGRLYDIYSEIKNVLTTKRRGSRAAEKARSDIAEFEKASLRPALDELKGKVNEYLEKYFKNKIKVDYTLSTLGRQEVYGPKKMLYSRRAHEVKSYWSSCNV
jgi:energy-coupling factor transporter ATP-binding protein EcfA2